MLEQLRQPLLQEGHVVWEGCSTALPCSVGVRGELVHATCQCCRAAGTAEGHHAQLAATGGETLSCSCPYHVYKHRFSSLMLTAEVGERTGVLATSHNGSLITPEAATPKR